MENSSRILRKPLSPPCAELSIRSTCITMNQWKISRIIIKRRNGSQVCFAQKHVSQGITHFLDLGAWNKKLSEDFEGATNP